MNFTNKVVIITGASSGIGAGAAEYISSLGGTVVLTGRNEENLKTIAEKCKGQVLSVVADVTVQADREKVINETIKSFGKIDVLVNNAGIAESGTILKATMNQYDNIMDTNLRSVFHLTQLAAPYLIKSKGNIVNVSSVCGLRAFRGVLVYCMSKAALDQYTRCVALELAPRGVRVNAINPAVIVTDIHRRSGMDEATYEKYLEFASKEHALGRVGTVEETSHAIAFLASNEVSSFITGVTLSIDGGKAAMTGKL